MTGCAGCTWCTATGSAAGRSQVFDQIAYVNDDASKLYMFYVRCSTDCYEQRKQEIANVVSSFTVRETA